MTDNINGNTVKRLIKDIKEILDYSSKDNNIYYKHDDTNILTGYALIIGNTKTPYQYGNYLFKLIFPNNYPFSPPKVSFLTNDSICRYHPNLYKNGKCCLSILNTWEGEQWTSCQTILSILLTISSILQNNPLILEPGIKLSHPDVNRYNDIITYKNLDFCIKDVVNMAINDKYENDDKHNKSRNELKDVIFMFKSDIISNFEKNKDTLLNIIKKFESSPIFKISSSIYGLTIYINYKSLIIEYDKIEI